jgi:hypothetical protein
VESNSETSKSFAANCTGASENPTSSTGMFQAAWARPAVFVPRADAGSGRRRRPEASASETSGGNEPACGGIVAEAGVEPAPSNRAARLQT